MVENQPQADGLTSGSSGVTGSTIVPEYTERRMRFYPVTNRDMRELTLFSAAAVIFFSGGSFFLSTAISLYTGGVFAEPGKMTSEGHVLSSHGSIAAVVMAVLCYAVGIVALVVRSSSIADIKKESKAVKATVRISADGNADLV